MNNISNEAVKAVCKAVFCVFRGYSIYYADKQTNRSFSAYKAHFILSDETLLY